VSAVNTLDFWAGMVCGILIAIWAWNQSSFLATLGAAVVIGVGVGIAQAVVEDMASVLKRRWHRAR
jgi:hypothetical protein